MAAPMGRHGEGETLNFNVGVLGHVDSGKTSLAKALSSVASTASFDKNPQSKERGITLDLGFSSFTVDIPEHLEKEGFEKLQYTLVDCPGHASLIRTIIGGAQIIDLMMLVVDVTKGIQTQTAECLVIGEIMCKHMVLVLNKIDLLPQNKRQVTIEKMSKRLLKTLENTPFAGAPIIAVAAKPGGPDAQDIAGEGLDTLISTLNSVAYMPQRNAGGNLTFAVDHCFSIRGQGTVMTGTVLSGALAVNDTIEIPSMKVTKKVKSMQMFRKPVERAKQGDRVGICVTQFDPKLLERGLVCTPSSLPTIVAALVSVHRISYFKGSVASKAKFHITVGHETVMGKAQFFGAYKQDGHQHSANFNISEDYRFQDTLLSLSPKFEAVGDDKTTVHEEDATGPGESVPCCQYAVLELEKPVTCPTNTLVIGSKLDTDIHTNVCRLAFHGQMLETITDTKYVETFLPKLKVYKNKSRTGVVERKVDDYSVICKGLFKKESNIDAFVNLKVKLSTGEDGVIEGGFGQSGKFKVRLNEGLSTEAQALLAGKGKKGKGKPSEAATSTLLPDNVTVMLNFKRYIYDPKKQMKQTA